MRGLPGEGTKGSSSSHGRAIGLESAVAVVPVDGVKLKNGRGNRRSPGPSGEPEDGSQDEGTDKAETEVQLRSEELGGKHGTENDPSEDGLNSSTCQSFLLLCLRERLRAWELTSKIKKPAGPEYPARYPP